jgi:activator of HSP90 ATPase
MAIETGTIHQAIMFPAAPEVVYDMLMDPEKHSQFTGSVASGSSEVGGTFLASNGYITIKNLELENGKRIVQEWSTTEWPAGLPPSRLEIRLRPIGQGTDLDLLQTGVPIADLERYDQGWYIYYWNPLFEHLRILSVKRQGKL